MRCGRVCTPTVPVRRPQSFVPLFSTQSQGPKYADHFSELFCTIVEQQNQAKVWMCRPRYQKSSEYESLLAVEIRRFLNGNSTPLQSLSNVSEKWKQLGKSLDLEFQKQVNLETLGAK